MVYKPICLINTDGFYDGFAMQMERAHKEGYMHYLPLYFFFFYFFYLHFFFYFFLSYNAFVCLCLLLCVFLCMYLCIMPIPGCAFVCVPLCVYLCMSVCTKWDKVEQGRAGQSREVFISESRNDKINPRITMIHNRSVVLIIVRHSCFRTVIRPSGQLLFLSEWHRERHGLVRRAVPCQQDTAGCSSVGQRWVRACRVLCIYIQPLTCVINCT